MNSTGGKNIVSKKSRNVNKSTVNKLRSIINSASGKNVESTNHATSSNCSVNNSVDDKYCIVASIQILPIVNKLCSYHYQQTTNAPKICHTPPTEIDGQNLYQIKPPGHASSFGHRCLYAAPYRRMNWTRMEDINFLVLTLSLSLEQRNALCSVHSRLSNFLSSKICVTKRIVERQQTKRTRLPDFASFLCIAPTIYALPAPAHQILHIFWEPHTACHLATGDLLLL